MRSLSFVKKIAMMLGPLLMLTIKFMPRLEGLEETGQSALAVLVFCIVWWVFSPVALPVTSLLGLALLPLLGAVSIEEAFALFGNQAVFFVMGVFLVASIMLQTGLSARLALVGLRRVSDSEEKLCNGVLFLSWILCSFLVSHAVAALLLPMILGLLRELNLSHNSRFAKRILLSMAWGTVCGSNLGLLSSARASLSLELFENYREGMQENIPESIGILDFTLAAFPLSFLSVILSGIVLHRLFPAEGVDLQKAIHSLDVQIQQKGDWSKQEKRTAILVLFMIATMMVAGAKWLGIIALLFCGAFFALQLLRWEEAEKYVNWGVVLLYGGAIAVGSAVHTTGAANWMMSSMIPTNITDVSPLLVLLLMGGIATFCTELVSNSAVIAILLPVGLALCEPMGINPRSIAVLAPVCAGFAFVLPTSTPALAMVFGVGYLRTRDSIWGVCISIGTLILFLMVAHFWWPIIGFSTMVQ